MKLVISDSHEGIKAAASKVLKATCQRCRVHFMRNALAFVRISANVTDDFGNVTGLSGWC